MNSSLIKYARKYRAHGFSILRTDGKKVPVGAWKALQTEPVKDEAIEAYFNGDDIPADKRRHVTIAGLGIICGAVSGGLEVIDVDTKHAADPEALYPDLVQAIMDLDPTLYDRLVISRTPSGGYHLIYRCTEVPVCGNTAIAHRQMEGAELEAAQAKADSEADAAGRDHKPVNPVRCFIETRGEGGYIAAVPTTGYKMIQGVFSAVPVLTASERETVWAAAYSLSTYIKPVEAHHHHAPAGNNGAGLTPLDDYNERADVVALLQAHGWKFVRQQGEKAIMLRPGTTDSKSSGDYHSGKRLFSVFTTSTQFEAMRGYSPAAVYATLEHGGDFKAAAKALYVDGYGERMGGKDKGSSVNDALRANMNKEREEELLTFWKVTATKKAPKIEIDKVKFRTFLEEQGGFGVYRYDSTKIGYSLIQVRDGIVTEVGSEHIEKFAREYIESLPEEFDGITRDDLENTRLSCDAIAKPKFFEGLARISPDFLKDTPDTAYYPFSNGVVCIDRDGVTLRPLADLGKCIWSTQIKDREISIIDGDNLDPAKIEFFEFISRICAGDPSRIEYCMAIFGYCLHGYKKASNSFCVIMCEETETKGGIGGTGKGIAWKALGQLVPKVFLDGKSPKIKTLNFVYERVQPDTKLLIIDDAVKNLDFESFFTTISEGIIIEKKHIGEMYIPYEDSPKLIFTTNYVIDSTSTAAQRRMRTLEFARFFHHGYTPKQHFGHELFVDWDAEEWNKFYNLLFACVEQYLINGVPVREASLAVRRRSIMEKYGESFLDYFDDKKAAVIEEWTSFNELYSEFLESENTEKKFYSAIKFKAALTAAATLHGLLIDERRGSAIGRKKEIRLVTKKTEKDVHDSAECTRSGMMQSA